MGDSTDNPARDAAQASRSLWGLHVLQVGAIAFVLALWAWAIPELIQLPAQLVARLQSYVVYCVPLVLVVLVANQLWLGPVVRNFHSLVRGENRELSAERLLRRVTGYPYHAFLITWIGATLTAIAISAVFGQMHATPTWRILELLVLAASLAVVAALLLFLIGRLWIAPYLRLPGIELPGISWAPDLRKRLVLASACVASVSWSVASVLVFEHLRQTAIRLHGQGAHSAGALHPEVASAALCLVVGGVGFVVLAILGSYLVGGDLAREPIRIAEGLTRLAEDAEAPLEPRARAGSMGPVFAAPVPVVSPDEFGELTAALNRLGLRMQQRSAATLERASLARKAEARQVEFIELVSRSLRTPLHSIIGFSELLAEGLEGNLLEGQQEDVHSIYRSGHHLLCLVDDLVDYTRLEGGYLALSTEAVDLAEIAAQALDAASGLRRDKSIELKSQVGSDLPKIEADPTRLRQILINLIGNAIKFTDRGSVQVSASLDEPGWLRVKVSDQGPGIPDESLGRVFGEFETVRSISAPSPIKGTGLGLAITRRLVELHGGQISVQNQPSGGAEFWFTLPLHRSVGPGA